MNKKSPISILQEFMAKNKLPLPVYSESISNNLFICKVVLPHKGKQAIGTANSKKQAKTICAEKALELININENNFDFNHLKNSNKRNLLNFVGELNEFASKAGLMYPKYKENSVENEFIITCEFGNEKCEGLGVNKKQAKQNAAEKMLQKFKNIQIENDDNYKINCDLNTVLSTYNCLKKRHTNSNLENRLEIESNSIINPDEDSIPYLKAQLDSMNMPYTINPFGKNNCFQVIESLDGKITVIQFGKTKEDAIKNVLKETLTLLKIGFSFLTEYEK